MAKKAKRRVKRALWTKDNLAELRKYSKDKLPVTKISKLMKRTAGALRQKARVLGIKLGHRR
jgi:hypothetical protein